MSPITVMLLIVGILGAALFVPLALLLLTMSGQRFARQPRVQAFFERLPRPRPFSPESFFRWQVFTGVVFLVLGVMGVLMDSFGHDFWLGLGSAHLVMALLVRLKPEWWSDSSDDPFAELEATAAEAAAAPAAPVPEIKRSTWRRIDRPLSAAELRRAARGDKLEPIDP